eukprot:CAMPEP_0170592098 /NCGR_PEP_ID=MMETSP0224-20130122/12750_1 /TAXON_ID=285029 /ORGANISM="Togula jolla, Strain CCCM 725" /LENGTH=111 /DNA_ID=CAMNT_0010915995 /DNA_START=91 /DNA_END=423 /DNA_ORIENTATION=-
MPLTGGCERGLSASLLAEGAVRPTTLAALWMVWSFRSVGSQLSSPVPASLCADRDYLLWAPTRFAVDFVCVVLGAPGLAACLCLSLAATAGSTVLPRRSAAEDGVDGVVGA